MKTDKNWVRLGLALLFWLGLNAAPLPAREFYDDKEVWGSVLKVDLDNHYLKVDRGPAHKVLNFKWNSKTDFREKDHAARAADLKIGQRIRVFYTDNERKTGRVEPVASKVIINPVSTSIERRYNE